MRPSADPLDALLVIASSDHGPEGHLQLPRVGAAGAARHDHLDSAANARAWLGARGEFLIPRTTLAAPDLRRLRELRAATQALVRGRRGEYQRRADALRRGALFRVDRDGRPSPARRGWAGFVDRLVPPLTELAGKTGRLKRCANPRCGWLFLDRSRNRRGRWCDPATCGNRMKVRAFRVRGRTQAP